MHTYSCLFPWQHFYLLYYWKKNFIIVAWYSFVVLISISFSIMHSSLGVTWINTAISCHSTCLNMDFLSTLLLAFSFFLSVIVLFEFFFIFYQYSCKLVCIKKVSVPWAYCEKYFPQLYVDRLIKYFLNVWIWSSIFNWCSE